MARHAKRVALVPLFAQEPTGIENPESWQVNFIQATMSPCQEGVCYWQALFCPDHRIGYLAAERFRHRLECNARRGTGVAYGRGSSG